MSSHEEHPLWRSLQDRRRNHHERSRTYRIAFTIGGFAITLGGLVMLVTPGPALVVIPIGLAMLSMEFVWAERALERALKEGIKAQQTAKEASREAKILTAAAVVCAIAAFVTAAILWDIPLVPLL